MPRCLEETLVCHEFFRSDTNHTKEIKKTLEKQNPLNFFYKHCYCNIHTCIKSKQAPYQTNIQTLCVLFSYMIVFGTLLAASLPQAQTLFVFCTNYRSFSSFHKMGGNSITSKMLYRYVNQLKQMAMARSTEKAQLRAKITVTHRIQK